MAHDAERRRSRPSRSAASADVPVTFALGRHQPQRPGPDRRHPGRRPPPLGRGRGARRRRALPGATRAPCWDTPTGCWRPYGRKLGPDPASTDAATVGGVIANNSGGMRCGVVRDSYSTVRELKLVLASGTAIDTAADGAAEEFAARGARAGRGARRDPRRAARRRRAHRAGPAQVRDQEHDGLPALRVPRRRGAARDLPPPGGGLGGDARVSSPRRRSRPCRCRGTRPSPGSTSPASTRRSRRCRTWSRPGPRAVELMVAPALIVASHNIPGTPEHWRELPGESAALLVEFGGETLAELDDAESRRAEAAARRARAAAARPPSPGSAEAIELAWRVREGMFGLIGKLRPAGDRADHRGRVRRARSGSPRRPPTSRRCSASTASSPAWPATRRRETFTSPSPRTSRVSPRTAIATRRSWARSWS